MPTVVTIRSQDQGHSAPPRASPAIAGNARRKSVQGNAVRRFLQRTTRRNGRCPIGRQDRCRRRRHWLGRDHRQVGHRSSPTITSSKGPTKSPCDLADGREFKGTDIKTDRIRPGRGAHQGRRRPAGRELGDSDKMEIGDWVIAVGNPFGLEDRQCRHHQRQGRDWASSQRDALSCKPTPPSTRATRVVRW